MWHVDYVSVTWLMKRGRRGVSDLEKRKKEGDPDKDQHGVDQKAPAYSRPALSSPFTQVVPKLSFWWSQAGPEQLPST